MWAFIVEISVCVFQFLLGAFVLRRPAASPRSDRRSEAEQWLHQLRDATGHEQCGQALPVSVR